MIRAQFLLRAARFFWRELGFGAFAGEHGRGLAHLEKLLDLHGHFRAWKVLLGLAYSANSRHDEAITLMEPDVQRLGRKPLALGALGLAHVRAGQRERARELLDQMRERRQEGFRPSVFCAWILAALGEKDANWIPASRLSVPPLIGIP